MPSQQKKIIFCMAGVLSFACALGVVTALGTPLWIKVTILCKTGALLVNASGQELDKFMGEMQYGLFHGEGVRQCGLGARPFRFSFFPDLLKAIPVSIHVNVILFSAILIVLTMVGTAFFMYNAFGKPFEILHGPLGLYLLSFISIALWLPATRHQAQGSCGCLVMILFASEVKIHHLSEKIANYKEGTYVYKTQSEKYTTSFWVVFICFFVHFLNGLLIRLAGFQFPFAKSKDTETTNVAADLMY
ncbi:clarin-1 isoform X1 [Symphalangus syndactylus]|uniref:clarin-1 isoform X1 n=1 Tax=Symphalangus syndactylus TaxID=9590 RepID=UPI002441FF22|nr:clarin-1 isoform X2 [Symphalangus syndactylus]XP_055103514.1 clarin-1 isoform X1 [Symphalangus syndactylus]